MSRWFDLFRGIAIALVGALIAFCSRAMYKYLTGHYDKDAVVIMIALCIVGFLTFGLLVFRGSNFIAKELTELKVHHALYIISIGLFAAIATWLGSHSLHLDGISHHSTLHTSMEIIIAMIGGWILFSEELTPIRLAGACTVLLGASIMAFNPPSE